MLIDFGCKDLVTYCNHVQIASSAVECEVYKLLSVSWLLQCPEVLVLPKLDHHGLILIILLYFVDSLPINIQPNVWIVIRLNIINFLDINCTELNCLTG